MSYEDYKDLSKLYYERLSLLLHYLSEHKKTFEMISTYFDLDVISSSVVSIDSLVLQLIDKQQLIEDIIFKIHSIVDDFYIDFVHDKNNLIHSQN